MTHIIEINTYSTEYHEAMQCFLDQLTTNPMTLTESMFRQLVESTNSHLFFLIKDEQIAGMLTVGIYYSPTGGKAWIEDVVVDEAFLNFTISVFAFFSPIPLICVSEFSKADFVCFFL